MKTKHMTTSIFTISIANNIKNKMLDQNMNYIIVQNIAFI